MKTIMRIHPSPRNIYGRGQKDIPLNASLEKHNLTKGDHISITTLDTESNVSKTLRIKYESKDYVYPKTHTGTADVLIYHFIFCGSAKEFALCVAAYKKRAENRGFPSTTVD